MGRLRCPRPTCYARHSCVGKVPLCLSYRPARDVADPEPRLEAATPIEFVHPRVLPAALHQDVVTIPAPGFGEGGIHNGASMALTLKRGMGDDIFEKTVPPSGAQEIWRRDQHAACNDLCIHGGYEDRGASVG